MTDKPSREGLPAAQPGVGTTGFRCDRRATHEAFLVYEPRQQDSFTIYVSGLHEFHPLTRQRISTHRMRHGQRSTLRQAVAEICTKMSDHGLSEPQWTGNYVLLGHYVTDRDYVLLSIADRWHELCPEIDVKLRFAETECINSCCR